MNDKTLDCSDLDRHMGKPIQPARLRDPVGNIDIRRWARYIGMPRGYGYGASMGAWILDYLAGWAGEWGMVVHSSCAYRGPAFTGDITIMTANVIDKLVDDQGRNVVQVDVKMSNQLGTVMSTAKAEIELPKK